MRTPSAWARNASRDTSCEMVLDPKGMVHYMDSFEAMGSAMSMRWLSSEPVSEEHIERLVWAATRASNPGNSQLWDFVVVRDASTRAQLAGLISEGHRSRPPRPALEVQSGPQDSGVTLAMQSGVDHLMDSLADVPIMVFICGTNAFPPDAPNEEMMLSAVHGAAQNLMVAARAMGLGAAYTTFHRRSEPAIKELLGIPDHVTMCVTIPVGWPTRQFVELKRRPVKEVMHYDHW